jgi:hypothetical protein
MNQTLQLIPVTDHYEIESIKEGLHTVVELCIRKAQQAAEEGRQLDMSAYMSDAEAVKRVIRTLRSA